MLFPEERFVLRKFIAIIKNRRDSFLFVKCLKGQITRIDSFQEGLLIKRIDSKKNLEGLEITEKLKKRIELNLIPSRDVFVGIAANIIVHISFIDYEYPVGVLIFGDFTLPEYRGKHINSSVKSVILEYLRNKGIKNVYISCSRENKSSSKAILRSGFKHLNFWQIMFVEIRCKIKKLKYYKKIIFASFRLDREQIKTCMNFRKTVTCYSQKKFNYNSADVLNFYHQTKGSEGIIKGKSMYPTLKENWKIRIRPVDVNKIKVGDIVVFKTHEFNCHRILRKFKFLERIYFLHKGDNSSIAGIFEGKNFVGIVTEVFDENGVKVENFNCLNIPSRKIKGMGVFYFAKYLIKRFIKFNSAF